MSSTSRARAARFTVAMCVALCGGGSLAGPALAQTVALPTAPGADRATQGGASMAPASLPKVAGASPLEPYLITWLLPVFGLLIFGISVGVDRTLRARVSSPSPR